MDTDFKKIIAGVSTLILLGIAIYGSYLPYRKSELYIASLSQASSATTLKGYTDATSVPLDAPSPIGQEELVRNTAGTVTGIIQASGPKSPDIIPPLLAFLNSYYDPIIQSGKGMSFNQNLYILGSGDETAFSITHDPKYILLAQQYFEQGLLNSPKRPQFIYGLFDVYRMEGDAAKAKQMFDLISQYWPADTRVKSAYDDFVKRYAEFLKTQASSAKTKK
jgi:hypothetical protein